MDVTQVDMVKRHLAMVFRHEIDPAFGKDLKALRKLHTPNKEILYCSPFKARKLRRQPKSPHPERAFSPSDTLITC